MASVDLDSIRDLLLSDCSEDKLKALSEIEKSSDLQAADVFANEILVEPTTADIYELRYNKSVSVLFAAVGIAGMAVKIGVMLKGAGFECISF